MTPSRPFAVLRFKWSAEIITELAQGPRRFSDLQRILREMKHHKVLTENLRRLERAAIVHRIPQSDSGHGAYALTPAGVDLVPIMELARRWEREHGDASQSPTMR